MAIIVSALLIICLTLLCYAWVLYPLLLLLVTRRPTPDAQPPMPDVPPVVVLLSAYNEADVIAARIANLVAIDYPHDRMHVLIGTDGCTDNTAAAATAAAQAYPWISVITYNQNRGKVAVLRDLVSAAQQDDGGKQDPLLVFTDANTAFRSNALRQLVRHFEDTAVGGVCGRLIFTGTDSDAEQSYWTLENKLKHRESALDSCLGANGAIYALRSECFWNAIPANTIVDDFVIGMKVREAGWRLRYDPTAIAEEGLPAVKDEWQRRVRIGSGDYQAAHLCRACLHPRFGWFAWCFGSHKMLRWFSPHLILVMVGAAGLQVASIRAPLDQTMIDTLAVIVITGTVLMMIAALAGHLSRQIRLDGIVWKLCGGIAHFVTMQAALLVGFSRYCRGNLSGTWSRTPRAKE